MAAVPSFTALGCLRSSTVKRFFMQERVNHPICTVCRDATIGRRGMGGARPASWVGHGRSLSAASRGQVARFGVQCSPNAEGN